MLLRKASRHFSNHLKYYKKVGNKIFDPELMSKVIQALKDVYDPEMPVNIYDMGLIYDISLEEGPVVRVVMTLTNPNCPVADSLPAEVTRALRKIDGVVDSEVKITFDPPWDYDRMSDEARLDMGLL
jgi:FeS assembly SUF system protein